MLFNRVLWLLINIPLGLITFSIMYVAYLKYYPIDPAMRLGNSRLERTVIERGDMLEIHREHFMARDLQVTFKRAIYFENGGFILFEPVERFVPAGEKTSHVYVPLPNLMPGKYEYRTIVHYHENELRQVDLHSTPLKFEVR